MKRLMRSHLQNTSATSSPDHHGLAALPARGALLLERRRTLAGVLGGADRLVDLPLPVEPLGGGGGPLLGPPPAGRPARRPASPAPRRRSACWPPRPAGRSRRWRGPG